MYARKESVAKCKLHQQVRDLCTERLVDVGYFSKEEIIEELQFETIADSIRWDFIRWFLEQDQGCELIALSKAFFKKGPGQVSRPPATAGAKMRDELCSQVPARYIALGNGKSTWGYASINVANGALAIRRLKHKQAVSIGAAKAASKLHDNAEKQKLLPPTQPQLPSP